jgi:hypothetical protein
MKSPKHILVICSWSRVNPLVHRYVLPYLAIVQGHLGPDSTIHLMTYEQTPELGEITAQPSDATWQSLNVRWVPQPYSPLRIRGWWLYIRQIFAVRRYCRQNRITTLHAFAPVAGAVAWLSSRLSSRKLIIDSWEPHAECMVETGVWNRSSLSFRLLWWMEKKMAHDADILIAAHPEMIRYAEEKWQFSPAQVRYRPACVNLEEFNPARFDRTALRKKFSLAHDAIVCVCASQLGGMYYLDESLMLFDHGRRHWGNRFVVQLLTSTPKETILERANAMSLNIDHVHIHCCAPEDVPEHLALADFAYNPQKAVASKRYGTPVKNGEYWAMGLPIAMMKETSQDSTLAIAHQAGVVLEDMSIASMSWLMEQLELLLNDSGCRERCRSVAQQTRSFAIAEEAYRSIYG